ncbi:MAG: FAD-binding oxidoreductase [Planctomycetes bacterium]|nr:FAD-binding oxidoreductase [Planctomycetota bacterium]MCH9723779.1 FAD-binding oxidoreductase [Planctomycetota bacterium]MCH9776091.1 FAD-binding oxidoreductase [Planctomycetota bacterium]MCH9791386.1 FAD-binding oxidoreductase [Planctomycetota bacterium]
MMRALYLFPQLSRPNRVRRNFVVLTLLFLLLTAVVISRPILHLARTAWKDTETRAPAPEGFADDASRMNLTEVSEIWPVPLDTREAETQLARLFKRARRDGLEISIAGARHSMGGHTLIPGGIMIDMTSFNKMSLDEKANLLHVQSGAKWSEIIPWLDQRGKSVAIMQSNNSFTVGGSVSVNCHGWQYGRPPIASSVESFRLMLADGAIVNCSRSENTELFSLALGGYGLFGVILDVDLRVIPNERYRLEQSIVPVEIALNTFDQMIEDSNIEMTFARMNIASDQFLKEVIINVLYRDPTPDESMPDLVEPGLATIRRHIFRGSSDSDYGKKLRWKAETKLQPRLQQTYYSRNQLLNEGVEVFENRSADYTDILHEYFVPKSGLVPFTEALREIIPRHKQNLLNVTIRQVEVDEDTFLRYADQRLFAFVLLFYQPQTEEGDRKMEAMSVELIEAALQAQGRYYLPYRLHATPEQFHRAYPQAKQFFELKRDYDPQELFQNQFYRKYGQPLHLVES